MTLQTKDPSTAIISTVGTARSGGTTTSVRPVITGKADAGNIVVVYDGIKLLGSVVAAADGAWTLTPTVDIKAGAHNFAAIAHDTEGNFGASSALVNVTIVATVTPPVAFVVDGFKDDTGQLISSGGTTADQRPSISGTASPGDTVTLYDGATMIGSVMVGADGKWSITPASALSNGSHELYAVDTNPSSALSTISDHFTFTVASRGVPAPIITLIADYDVTGMHQIGIYYTSGCVIASPYVNLNGTGEAGDIITIYDGLLLLGSVTVRTTGKWLFAAPDFSDGTHDLYVTQTDTTGAVSASSNHFIVTIDTTTPKTPVVDSVADTSGHLIPSGGSTADPHPSITGTGSAGHTITLYDGSAVIGSSTVSAAGTWSITPVTDLPDGSHNVYAVEQNLAGTSSAASNHIVFDVYHLPAAPTIFVLGEYDVNHVNVGNLASGGTTAYPRLQLEGYSVPGALIKVYDGTNLVGSAIAKSNGSWFFYSENWANGQHDLSATQTNTTGVESARSEHVIYTVQYNEPAAPAFRGVSVWDANDQCVVKHLQLDSVITYPYINVAGRGEPNGIITVYDGSTVLGTVVARDTGAWLFQAPVLADGLHDLTLTLTNATGEVSPHSNIFVLTIDTSGYAAPIILSMQDSTGTVPAGHLTHDTQVVVNGTGKIGDLITLYDGSTIIGSAIVDSTRHWSIETGTPLTNGTHDLVAMSAMATGTPDAHSDHYIFVVNTESLAAPEITGSPAMTRTVAP